jgi:hypothetical protein
VDHEWSTRRGCGAMKVSVHNSNSLTQERE